jgi:hypothetical protein
MASLVARLCLPWTKPNDTVMAPVVDEDGAKTKAVADDSSSKAAATMSENDNNNRSGIIVARQQQKIVAAPKIPI